MSNIANKDEVIQLKRELIEIAQKMIYGEVDLIEGCRKIIKYRYKIEDSNEVFLPFIGLDSETDDLPCGNEKKFMEAEALARKDKEKEAYLAIAKPSIIKSCQHLIDAFMD